ncbi:alpha-N-acetylgalactosamine-specific lectin-like [Branchiostoma floridae]|uniref:Alpha-N-acetylgalactosamine-specific lectin-like n=1 Tax=Branchiostoma floridae TaxID=7739 RepID=A0A9J7M7N4_BRAFL|nr:alpha-N-acetylgalactosamine-specific lectin-like [Branchiostoma floridae]
MTAGIAVLLSLVAVGLAPLTFINKEEIYGLSTAFDTFKRDQDNMSTIVDDIGATVDALKRDQDDIRKLSTTVDVLKRDQDEMRQLSTILDALKRDLDNVHSRIATFGSCLHGYTAFRGICYKAFNRLNIFSGAAAACRQDGGTLAMPRDAETNAFLISLYKSVRANGPFWFGLHDQREEGSFEWVDGSALGTYNSWGVEQPDDKWGKEDCVYYSWTSTNIVKGWKEKWNDAPCNEQHRFICQAVPGRP